MRPVHWSAQVVVVAPRKDATMKIPGMKYGAGRGPGRSAGVAVAVLLAAGAVSGWGLSTAFGTRAAAVESQFELTRNRDAGETTRANHSTRFPAFVDFPVFEKRLDIGPVRQAALGLEFLEQP